VQWVVTSSALAFSDAARVGVGEFRHDAGVYGRLLGLALPLTVVAGAWCAWWVLGAPAPRLALLVTILLSVLAHGVTAGPLAVRYGRGTPPDAAPAASPEPIVRGRRSTAGHGAVPSESRRSP
jgi:hypothetical protein